MAEEQCVKISPVKMPVKEGATKSPEYIFVLGPPSAGKGTILTAVCEQLSLLHLSVGDYLRDCSRNEQWEENDHELWPALRDHKPLPSDKLIPTMHKGLAKKLTQNPKKFMVVDGFPRKEDSIEWFSSRIKKPMMTIVFDCPKKIAHDRYVNRNHPDRPGENTELFEHRYVLHETATKKILGNLKNMKEHESHTIDTTGGDPNEKIKTVWELISSKLTE